MCSSTSGGGDLSLQKLVYFVLRPVEFIVWNVLGTQATVPVPVMNWDGSK